MCNCSIAFFKSSLYLHWICDRFIAFGRTGLLSSVWFCYWKQDQTYHHNLQGATKNYLKTIETSFRKANNKSCFWLKENRVRRDDELIQIIIQRRETVHFHLSPPNNPNKRINRGEATVKRIYHWSLTKYLILLVIIKRAAKANNCRYNSEIVDWIAFPSKLPWYIKLNRTMIDKKDIVLKTVRKH